jgi:hypothetical protein
MGDTILAHLWADEEGWIVDTDALGYALGAVLSQVQKQVIRYSSKSLSPEQRRYCTTKRELLGVTWALQSFRYYLQGRHCLLRANYASVRWWRTMEVGMPDVILRWLQYMSTFDIEVEYKPGQNHGNTDALFRPTDACETRGCICLQAHDNMSWPVHPALHWGTRLREPSRDSYPKEQADSPGDP